MKLFLIRHAQSAPDPSVPEDDWPLSELGRAQAQALKDELLPVGIEEVYASPYPRAVDTVRPLAEALGLEVHTVHDLRERRLSTGRLADWRDDLRRSFEDHDLSFPGGESNRACQARLLGCICAIVQVSRASTIALASHGNAIAMVLHSLDPSFGFEAWRAIPNPAVYRLHWDGSRLSHADG